MHAELAEAMPVDLHADHADDLAVGHRHVRAGGDAGELRGPLVDVDGGSVAIPSRSAATAANSSAMARASSADAGRTTN